MMWTRRYPPVMESDAHDRRVWAQPRAHPSCEVPPSPESAVVDGGSSCLVKAAARHRGRARGVSAAYGPVLLAPRMIIFFNTANEQRERGAFFHPFCSNRRPVPWAPIGGWHRSLVAFMKIRAAKCTSTKTRPTRPAPARWP